MRFFLFVLFAAITSISGTAQTIVSGQLKGKGTDSVIISQTLNHLDFDYKDFSVLPDKKGAFRITLPLTQPCEVYLQIGDVGTELYLHPGDSLFLCADLDNFTHSLTYSGHGAEDCNYYAERARKFGDGDKRSYDNVTHQSVDSPGKYLHYCDSLETQMHQFLIQHKDFLSPECYTHEKDYIQYQFLSERMRYPLIHGYTGNLKINSFTDSLYRSGYYSFLQNYQPPKDSVPDNDAAPMFFEDFVSYLYLPMWFNKNNGNGGYSSWETYQIAKIVYDGKVQDFAAAFMLLHVFDFGRPSLCDSLYADFHATCKDSAIGNLVSRHYTELKRLAPGSLAPRIELTDINGNPFSLDQYKGKLVYVDFWSVGCSPCLKEFPHADSLEHDFEEKGVVFVYINCDSNINAWKKMVKEKKLRGIHLNAGGVKHPVTVAYNVSAFPTYILIGRDGKIIDNHPPRPSSPKLREILLKSL